jgi:hypothetical protein
LEPQFSHFTLLKRQLARYRALADEDGLNDLPALSVKSIKPGGDYAGTGKSPTARSVRRPLPNSHGPSISACGKSN